MEFVFIQLQTLLNQLIWDVPLGIGPTKNVLPAHKDGFSTPMEFVFQFLTIVIHGMLAEPVQFAIRDIH
jgi:hypothetical protein